LPGRNRTRLWLDRNWIGQRSATRKSHSLNSRWIDQVDVDPSGTRRVIGRRERYVDRAGIARIQAGGADWAVIGLRVIACRRDRGDLQWGCASVAEGHGH